MWVSMAGVLIALAAVPIAVWATRRYSRRRRRLFYDFDAVQIMGPVNPEVQGEIEVIVRRRGSDATLDNPHMITLSIFSRSDDDIIPEFFQGPLVFDFGAPVIALMKTESEPGRKGVTPPRVETTATAVRVMPSLIARAHVIKCFLLVNGKPELMVSGSPANVSVDVKRGWGEVVGSPLMRAVFVLLVVILLMVAFSATLGTYSVIEWWRYKS